MRIAVILVMLVVSGCSDFRFPGVHRISIQQGNVISQSMVDKLKPGMSKNQVRYIMGNAIVNNTLNADRWDYVNDIKIGSGKSSLRRRISLFFTDDKLTHFEGDYKPTSAYGKKKQT